MSITSGTRLGPYEIVGAIGAGGMGEVYRARDTRLGRDVAVKVLSDAVAADPERIARFEREARAVAALSHPNILAIHDTGRESGQMFVVTELLAGETLRERMTTESRSGSHAGLQVRKALDIAVQITRGLAAAHDKGLVHRDLKPENVFLLADGQVKILDFGLAKSIGPEPSASAADATKTVVASTDPGTVMGTIGYMAPEQVRGLTVDARTDLFALGAVLYEMLAGRRAFKGDTAADTMVAIVKEDPPELAGARADVPPALDRIVRHCLEKNPAERFQSARDVGFALEALSGTGPTTPMLPAKVEARARRAVGVPVVIGMLVLAVAAGVIVDRWLSPAATPPTFTLRTFEALHIFNARFMPDGQSIVYSASAPTSNDPSLFQLRADSTVPQKKGPAHTHLLSVSSSGELAVLTDAGFIGHRLFDGTLATMTLDGAPRKRAEHVREADWAPNGELAVVRDLGSRDRLEFPIDTVVYEAATGYLSDIRVSPDGTQIAFLEHPFRFDDTGSAKILNVARHEVVASWPFLSGQGMAWRDRTTVLFSAAPFSTAARSSRPWWHRDVYDIAVGRSDPRLALSTPGGLVIQDISKDGQLLGFRQEVRNEMRAWFRDKPAEQDIGWLDSSERPKFTPRADAVVYDDEGAGSGYGWGVSIRGSDGSPPVLLGEGMSFGVSPDGKWVLATSVRDTPGAAVLYSTGTEKKRILDRGPIEKVQFAAWFPGDDQRILICGAEPKRAPRCYSQKVDGGAPAAVTAEGVSWGWVRPDGQMLISNDATSVSDPSSHWRLFPLNGGSPQDVPSVPPDAWVAGWASDNRSVFVARGHVSPLRIERLDLATGRSELVHTLTPPTTAFIDALSLTGDGRSYGYRYVSGSMTMFVVSGPGAR